MKTKVRPTFRRPAQPSPPAVEPEPKISDQEALVIRTTAFVEALYQGWFATALEQTKSIFTLSSAGVGLALTLLFSAYKDVATWIPIWLLASALLFGLAATACIAVFTYNAQLVKTLIHDRDEKPIEALVRRLHRASLFCFLLGIICLIFAGWAFILFGKSPAP
jgi:hypothetical protein